VVAPPEPFRSKPAIKVTQTADDQLFVDWSYLPVSNKKRKDPFL
jgi:hypothetical protein